MTLDDLYDWIDAIRRAALRIAVAIAFFAIAGFTAGVVYAALPRISF